MPHTQLTITSLAYGGDGISRLDDGRVAFIPNTVPGDKVLASITHEEKGFVRGAVQEIVEPSAARIAPPCPYAGVCGGCQWQHISYDEQLKSKRQAVVDALVRIGKIENADGLTTECIPSPKQFGYRNKIELGVKRDAQRRITLGMFSSGSNHLEPIDRCLLLPKQFEGAPKSIRGVLRYLEGSDNLGVTRIGLRTANRTNSSELALWTQPGAFPRGAAAKSLSSALPLTSIVRPVYKDDLKKRKVTKVEVLSGKGFWEEKLNDNLFMLSAPSFFQVNTRGAELLVSQAIEQLEVDGTDRVLDLYSGAGTFTLELAKRAHDVTAVESAGSSVRDLRRNLERANLDAEVIGGDSERELSALRDIDSVIVDPPRNGLGPTVPEKISATGARSVAYVSCDPTTLARDLKRLCSEGFEIARVTPFDLFPQTYHIETLVLLTRSS